MPSGDITTKLIKKNTKIKAKIISNQNCVIGGLNFAKEAFKYSDNKISYVDTPINIDVKVKDLAQQNSIVGCGRIACYLMWSGKLE